MILAQRVVEFSAALYEVFPYIIFMFGAIIGSFLNVVIYRVPLGLNIAVGRSFCPNCKTNLGVLDLFPLFSYIFLGGKCRYCKVKIPIRYFLVELISATLFLVIYLVYGFAYSTAVHIVVVSLLISVSFIDYDHHKIPNSLVALIFLFNAFLSIVICGEPLIKVFLSTILFPAPFIITNIIAKIFSKKGFGFGDIKLASAIGAGVLFANFFIIIRLTLYLLFIIIVLCYIFNNGCTIKKFPFAPILSIVYVAYLLMIRF